MTGHTMPAPAALKENSDRSPSVSIRDVAREAGVSYQTVSRVINQSPSVKSSTRETVLDAIARLGFRPNRAARALAGGPVQSVTVLASNTSLYGFAAALEGIEEATREVGFGMAVRVVESIGPDDVRDAVEHALEPAGAVIVIAFDRPGVAALECVPFDVPAAAMIPAPTEKEVPRRPSVWIDEYAAAMDATRYLLGLGHETVHHLSIPTWTGTTRRMSGWLAALKEARVPPPKPMHGGWSAEWGYEAGEKLARDLKVTAVLCGNDDIALGAMRAMHEAGRAVPADVSIVGFDDVPFARFYTPALTTVRQDFKALGRACFATLMSFVDPARAARGLELPEARLVVRESAGPPPGAPRGSSQRRGAPSLAGKRKRATAQRP
ncbi:MAG TPA: LacI family DNA-binding transcriptional regulator [Acidimicrobiales bacterium]|nr:LacI family DNA-binding transcriptional regulator [Acidimicrobiales bacterium]